MGLFSRRKSDEYQACVDKYYEKFCSGISIFSGSNQFASTAGVNKMLIAYDLECELKEMNCPDVEKYVGIFNSMSTDYVDKMSKGSGKERKAYERYLNEMERVARGKGSPSDKKRKLNSIVEHARGELGVSLFADLSISKRQKLENEIDIGESSKIDSYVNGRIDALYDMPGSRRTHEAAMRTAQELLEQAERLKTSQDKKGGGKRF